MCIKDKLADKKKDFSRADWSIVAFDPFKSSSFGFILLH